MSADVWGEILRGVGLTGGIAGVLATLGRVLWNQYRDSLAKENARLRIDVAYSDAQADRERSWRIRLQEYAGTLRYLLTSTGANVQIPDPPAEPPQIPQPGAPADANAGGSSD